ncbi:MAG: cytochrome c biogenesis protein CcsA [Acidobacteriaceae bacterium]|nr:cytochrome c biogenesis protein CcsA [Acidobacteriaceae bacterium]
MSVVWLRTAAALYSCGLLYALLYLFLKSTRLFRPALIAFGAGALFQFVSIVEFGASTGHLPLGNFYQTSSLCAFLIALAFLVAYSYYHIAVFSVCLFPLVFFMTLIAATEFPVAPWSNPVVRNTWLVIHVTTVLIGYAALVLSAVASIYYLLQERHLKRKEMVRSSNRLPPLATLDRLITQSMNIGFVFITAGTVTGIIWAFIESGTRWISDPKIAFFLFTWAFYLAMIFLRVSAGWRGRRMAWLAVSVLACSMITWATHVSLGSGLTR